MLSYTPCCISSPMQPASSSLLSSQDHCHHQETTSSITSSPTVSQTRSQQNEYQEQPIRLANMSNTSSPPLPPPLMIPANINTTSASTTTTTTTTTDENSNTNSTSSNDHHQYHSHSQHQHQQQQQYQHRHSSSSSSSPSWNLGYPPVTPPSNQQDVLMMDQSPLYDPYPSQQHQQSYHTHFRQPPMTSHPTNNNSTAMEPMFAHRGSTSSLSLMSLQHQHQQQLKKHLRFHIVLQATTAVTQKTEHSSLTYLNRGQSYGIQLTDKLDHDGLIQSQFVIMFHDPAHRKIALNYWKFWIGQQKDPQLARAVDLDSHQSIGIMNVRYPSFDRIAFDWHGRHGAKLFVRFHCLSTDFSRIKGVKGIPLRACMSSQISTDNDPLLQRHYSGSFQPHDNKPAAGLDYIEQSYCKVKLFRDKGAERKNKDDAKQLGKQFEKMMHEGDPRQHPMWLMYNESVPYSIFSETPSSPTLETFDHAMLTPASNSTTNAAVVAATTTNTPLTTLSHPRPKQFAPKLSTSLPTLSYHYQQHHQPSSSYQQQYKHHYHPYAKRPPPPTPNATTTVPTQLYSSTGYDSLLSSTTATTTASATSPLMPSSSSTSSSSSPPLPSFVSNSNSHSSTTTTTTGGDSNDSSVPSTHFYLPTASTTGGPDRQLKHMSSLQEQQQQQQMYQQAYPYHHQHQQQQHHNDRFSPIPSTDASILTAWRRS